MSTRAGETRLLTCAVVSWGAAGPVPAVLCHTSTPPSATAAATARAASRRPARRRGGGGGGAAGDAEAAAPARAPLPRPGTWSSSECAPLADLGHPSVT